MFRLAINKLFPPAEAQVRFPAGICQSWELYIRMKMTCKADLRICKASARHQVICFANAIRPTS